MEDNKEAEFSIKENGSSQSVVQAFPSYVDFLKSVFESMGIDIQRVEQLSVLELEEPDHKSESLNQEESALDDSRPELYYVSPNLGHPDQPFEQMPGEESEGQSSVFKRKRYVVDSSNGREDVYKRVRGNQLVRLPGSCFSRFGPTSTTMYFGTSTNPRALCRSYCKKGACPFKGRCRFVHDPSKVAICPEWLEVGCRRPNCLLQHEKIPELMPHCVPYQDGLCDDENCPYLHIIFNPHEAPCKPFQKSYCPRGVHCWRQHIATKPSTRLAGIFAPRYKKSTREYG